jgi:hypothetical protein
MAQSSNIKYDIIVIAVTWIFDDITIIKQYCETGWRFIGYSPDGKFAYFDRKWRMII